MFDLHHTLKPVTAISPVTLAATVQSQAVDRAGFNAVEAVVILGKSGDTLDTNNRIILSLQHGDAPEGPFEPVPAKELLGGIEGTEAGEFAVLDEPGEDDQVYRVGYLGIKRYVRVVATFEGTHSNGIPCAAVVLLGRPRHAPVS